MLGKLVTGKTVLGKLTCNSYTQLICLVKEAFGTIYTKGYRNLEKLYFKVQKTKKKYILLDGKYKFCKPQKYISEINVEL